MESIIILSLIPISISIGICISIVDKRKERREYIKLSETPIEVYRYTYKIYLNDGSNYVRLSNAFSSIDFEEFVERILLSDTTLEIEDGLVINTENISKVELVSEESKTIKPKVNKYYGSFYLSTVYSIEEVLEREIK